MPPVVCEMTPGVHGTAPVVSNMAPWVHGMAPSVREMTPAVHGTTPAVHEMAPAVREMTPPIVDGHGPATLPALPPSREVAFFARRTVPPEPGARLRSP
jgi:hypothetical protein